MNINLEYAEALTEVDIILQNLDEELVQKIPIKLKRFIKENKSKDYIPDIDVNAKLSKEDLKLKSRELLAYIYRNYLCDEYERKEYDMILKKNEIKYQNEINSKYSVEKLFKNKKQNSQNNEVLENIAIIEYKDKNFFEKLIQKIQKMIAKNR